MTAAIVALALALAGAIAALIAAGVGWRRAVRDEAAADRETTDALRLADSYRSERDTLTADLARITAERDTAVAVVGATRTAAVAAAEEEARATETAAAADSPAALAARVDELLGRPLAGLGPAGAPDRGGAGAATVPAAGAAGADRAGPRAGG